MREWNAGPLEQGDRIAIVTGASRGIGRAIALRLAASSAGIVVGYRSDEEAAREVVMEIGERGCRSVAIASDVSTPEGAQEIVSLTREHFGAVHIVVNNVGEFALGSVAETPVETWKKTIDSNLNSAYYVSRSAIPIMRACGYGRIVNLGLAPAASIRAATNLAAYTVAKTGVSVLTRTMAVEEAKYGITVNAVSPGLIDNGYLPPAQHAWMLGRVPMGRLGRPEEVAEVVSFLISKHASYVSGAEVSVSGAWDWFGRPSEDDHQVAETFRARADVAQQTEL